MPEGSSITAVLGPTNTGKTHRAVERMLSHESGIIGLPLRLLAREVYDRVTLEVGESRVALVTGEEKRVPRRPDYWVCTVEAMPTDREADFLAVDEIQLAAHDQRGHVFTERLLSARGRRETWFLGAETMRPLVSELCPTATHAVYPRLSRLASAGADKLSRLPPRSALIGFSMPQVYALAERVRALRGGAAVVLGALSPRTRNAQVAMFQSGEVDTMVATDAIGMGLNLDVSHVAFASLRKFDGRVDRELDAAEIGQIAGRAGRYLTDGTFGAVAPLRLPDGVIAAVEGHRFPAVRRLLWRSADLDLASVDTLLASLAQRPRLRCLKLVEDADDTKVLQRLALEPELRARARGPEAVGLLWDVCRIPDYRKLLIETHAALCAEIFDELTGPRGVLGADFMQEHTACIDDPAGDCDALIARIASIRTWTYISHQTRWVKGAAEWQERTRAIEDRLSDALHERLVQRFVERGATRRPGPAPRAKGRGRGEESEPARPAASHPFARLAEMRAALSAPAATAQSDPDRWAEGIIAAAHDRFAVDVGGRVLDGDRALGQLTRGVTLLLPEVKLTGLDDLGAGARSRVLRRLVAFARDLVEELLAPLRALRGRELSAAGRGVVYQLEQGLGTALGRAAEEQVRELAERDREMLRQAGVVMGERVIYVEGLLGPAAIEKRVALCRAFFGGRAWPGGGALSVAAGAGVDSRAYMAVGYPVFGGRALRADVAEKVHRALAVSDGERAGEGEIAGWVGCAGREVGRIVEALT